MKRVIVVLLLASSGCADKAPEPQRGFAMRTTTESTAMISARPDSAARDSVARDSIAHARDGVEEDRPCFASHLGLPCSSQ
jgi:hypothetical protein